MWPLGGIRKYLKYNYQYFMQDKFDITLLAFPPANREVEREAVQRDMESIGIKVIWAKPVRGGNVLFLRTAFLLLRGGFDLINSQGFRSAVHVSLVNWLFRKPHVLTMHGIIEEEQFQGTLGRMKRFLFERILRNVDVFVGVGKDAVDQVRRATPALQSSRRRWEVIRNGIDPKPCLGSFADAGEILRRRLNVEPSTFVIGYFGRFMPRKGFNYVIEAVQIIRENRLDSRKYVVMAVGSHDHESTMKDEIHRRRLGDYFVFLPFDPNPASLIHGCDLVVMPSKWEAFPQLSSEVLCCGTPLIATDSLGLREAVAETPAICIPSGDAKALAHAMVQAMENPELRAPFMSFRGEAAKRFEVKGSAERLAALYVELCEPKKY
jgi:glycosyltransferase involved in cell wall biosynthesis